MTTNLENEQILEDDIINAVDAEIAEPIAEGGVIDGNTKEYDSAWIRVKELLKSKERVNVLIIDANKGGLVADMGIKAFIPKANLSAKIASNLDKYIGQTLTVKVTEIDDESERLLLSERIVVEEDNAARRVETLKNLSVGQTVEGIAKRMTEFGVFVDIGGIDGLLHVSDMSWERIENPEEIVKVKDKIEVKILKIENDGKRISLGLKQLTENPWNIFRREAKIGDIIDCTVLRLESFGVVVGVKPAIDGVIPLRDLSDKRIETASGIVEVGETLTAKITDLNARDRKLTLSVRAAKRDSEQQEFRSYMKGQNERQKEETPTLGDLFGDLFNKIDD